ncbi:MAG TPA: copper chaperone PCu(A)C [Thermomicrobiales bacterium]|nr:copper chaperone PCu(A)C [Thermomicrobiales bacterium]
MNDIRLSRRRLVALGAAIPLTGLIAQRVSAAQDDPGATPAASPAATPTVNTGTAAVYFKIQNNASNQDTLTGATTTAAQSCEIHNMVMEGNVMSMIPVPSGVEIPAGGMLSFDPNSYHLMLVNLNHDLLPGSTFEVTLHFQNAGDVSITVSVTTDTPDDSVEFTTGHITVQAPWCLPAPMITAGNDMSGMDMGTPAATATPGM